MTKRPAVFISHANPEDNRFTLWLGAKLASLGYEVWADIMRLRGGDDWQRKLEAALRERACKVLLVANPVSVEKQGVRNEVQIASDVAKEIKDNEFIIPLRLDKFNAPFLIAHAQYIDFSKSWSRGLVELIEVLDGHKVPRTTDGATEIWRDIQLIHARDLIEEPETLISNWLSIESFPEAVRLYDFKGGISIGRAQTTMATAPWPLVEYKRGFLSFAPIHDLHDHFGLELPLLLLGEKSTKKFVEEGWIEHGVEFWSARNYFADLARQAMDRMFQSRQLSFFELANKSLAWWVSGDAAPTSMVSFKWGEISGRRQIQGASVKRGVQWHYGVSTRIQVFPIAHARVIGRLIFTLDGVTPLDAARMHRLRRSFAKAWRNARWRDMLLAFLWWVSDGKSELLALTSSDDGITFRLPPMTFASTVSLPEDTSDETDDDDPGEDEDADPAEDIEGDDFPEELDGDK